MGRISLEQRQPQVPAIDTGARALPATFGQAGLEGMAAVGAGLSRLGQGVSAVVREHTQRRQDAETRIDLLSGDSAIAAIYRQFREQAETYANHQQAREALDDAHKRAAEYLKGERPDGSPNVRWRQSQEALTRLVEEQKTAQEAYLMGRKVEWARRDDVARVESSATEAVQDGTEAGRVRLEELAAVLPHTGKTPAEAEAWKREKLQARDLYQAQQELRRIADLDVEEANQDDIRREVKWFRAAVRDRESGQFSDLTGSQREELAAKAADLEKAVAASREARRRRDIGDNEDAFLGEFHQAQQSGTVPQFLSELEASRKLGVVRNEFANNLQAHVLTAARERSREETAAANAEFEARVGWIELQYRLGRFNRQQTLEHLRLMEAEMPRGKASDLAASIKSASSTTEEDQVTSAGFSIIDQYEKIGVFGNRQFQTGKLGGVSDITADTRQKEMDAALRAARDRPGRLSGDYGPDDPAYLAMEDRVRAKIWNKWASEDRVYTSALDEFRAWARQNPQAGGSEIREQVGKIMQGPLAIYSLRLAASRVSPAISRGP